MSAEHLRSQSEHVLYEIEMFCALACYFESGEVDDAVRGLKGDGIVVRNAVIEAFQLHARQLIDFLTKDSDRRDMAASQFTTTAWRLTRTPEQEDDFARFSQRVMHLSVKRAKFTAAERQVETRRIRKGLGTDIVKFLGAVDEEKVCDGFVRRAEAALLASEAPIGASLTSVTNTPIVGATESVVPYSGGTATHGLPPHDVS
jgi:hypothetical protein